MLPLDVVFHIQNLGRWPLQQVSANFWSGDSDLDQNDANTCVKFRGQELDGPEDHTY